MIIDEKDYILETIRLAEEREKARAAYEAEHGPKKWGVYLPEEKALNDYLMTLGRETVEVLEVLMLLGRDDAFKQVEQSPEENYLRVKQERYHHHPDQQAAVYYLTGKKPLAQYMENGLAYLGIVL